MGRYLTCSAVSRYVEPAFSSQIQNYSYGVWPEW